MPESCRKVGAGVAIIGGTMEAEGRTSINDIVLQTTNVPGRYTIPRADLIALIKARAASKGSVAPKTIWSDSLYTVLGATKENKEKLSQGSNGDLRTIADSLQEEKIKTAKVKVHAKSAVLNGKMDPMLYLRSALANAAADVYAQLIIDYPEGPEAEKWEGFACNMTRRLAVLEMDVWEATLKAECVKIHEEARPDTKSVEEHALDMRSGIHRQGHVLRKEQEFVRLQCCRRKN